MRKLIIPLALLCGSAFATETPQLSLNTAPTATSPVPQVTTVHRAKETVEEYRLHDQLYMIKVMRNNGISYYLVDTDGDGKLDKRRDALSGTVQIPSWVASR